jgi:hypothetical protein
MLAAEIQKGFPKGVAVPDDLKALCTFADDNDGNVAGLFEFDTDGVESAQCWFDGDADAASQFAVFGRGPDGSLYAFWLHAGNNASHAPIVCLDSEGQGSQVIAGDFREFMQLLAIGYEEPGRYSSLEPDAVRSALPLRRWLKREFKLVPPSTGNDLVAKAQSRHPNLDTWIRAWQKRHFGNY